MKKIYFILFVFSLPLLLKAQESKGSLGGILIDSGTMKPISYATVSVYKIQDSALVSYKLSDEKGVFRISSLPLNTHLRLVITFTGYAVFRKEINLSSSLPIEMGKISMKPSLLSLDEIIIHSERPPVIVRKDTIEFNANAFKTLPDALVEDLLRKLPGVNVDKDGNIKVNGKTVTTLYVDGKDFFGGDIRIASKNLPANTIEKVQVMNDPEALRVNPLMAEADIPQVINLKLKPGIKKGVFGKLYAGGGIKDAYEAGGLLNLFRDTTQISLLGYGNNLNKAAFAFTDIRSVGGFNRSGWGNANGNGNGGLSIDKVSFGGFGSGLMNSSGGGGNFNTVVHKNVQLSLSYFYGAVQSDYDELRNTKQSFESDYLNTRQTMKQTGNNYAHMLGGKVVFNLTPTLRLDIKPQLVLTNDLTEQVYKINSNSANSGPLNESINLQQNKNNGTTFMLWAKLMPTFKKKGRVLDVFNNTVIDNSFGNLFNNVTNNFFQPPGQSFLDQLRKNDVKNTNSNFYARYTDLLNSNFSISSGLTVNYSKSQNDLNTFFPDVLGQYVVPISTLSEDYVRTNLKSEANVNVKWKHNKFSITPGLVFSTLHSENRFSSRPEINKNYFYLLPSVDVAYGIFNVNYQTSYREPALANLQPLQNNTNPLYITEGNPDLKPAFNNSFALGIRKYDTKRSLTYNANISTTLIKNATIISRTIDANGIQTTRPLNSDGTWGTSANVSFQKDWKLENNHQISLIASNGTSLNRSFIILNQDRSDLQTLSMRPSAEFRINLNDQFEMNQSYGYTSAKSKYKSSLFADQTLTYQDSRSEIIVRPSKHLVLETTLDYRYNSNAIPGLLKDYYKWNAAVTYIFLKGNRGQLKLAVNDILDQNIIANRIVRENYIQDVQGSTIRRYSLLTFTYNIRNFREKVEGRNQLFRF